MSELITRTARLVPYAKRPKQVPSFVTAYAYEPLPDEPGRNLGSLYAVMEVLVSGRASEEVADLIIETVGDHYYNQHAETADPLSQFENAIKATNRELSEYVNRGNAAWIGKLSAVIVIQVGADLHVAQTGSAEAFLYRGKASTRISQATNRPITPSKTFGSLASGQLDIGDHLLLATPALVHQVPLNRLHAIITSSSPNNAIAEITQLLRGTSTDRIAGMIIEVTTPELAALQVRSEQPDEIQLGTPENALEAAKMAATPIAQTTVDSSKKIASAAQSGWQRARPRAQAIGLAIAERMRQSLSTKTGRRRALAIGVAAILIFGGLMWYQVIAKHDKQAFAQYQATYSSYQTARQMLDNGDRSNSRNAFVETAKKLSSLKASEGTINRQISAGKPAAKAPHSIADLQALINNAIDEIDGLVKLSPTTIATIPGNKPRPEHFEIIGSKAYILNAAAENTLSIIDIQTGAASPSKASFAKLGDIVGTAVSSNNDGIYILTKAPSVWFYRLTTDSLTEQTINRGTWPAATAIASYAGNLYLLGADNIYKHAKTSTGFLPRSNYFTSGKLPSGTTGLSVDGYVYTLGSYGLERFAAGGTGQSTELPNGLKDLINLRSVSDTSLVIASSPTTNRIALWSAKDAAVTFNKQLVPSGISKLYDATYSAKTNAVYAVVDDRLVRLDTHL